MSIVALLEDFVNSLMEAEEKFILNPKDFYSFETQVKSSTEDFSAAFLSNVLTSINQQIYKDSWRQGKYTVIRTEERTLITSVGDVIFENTYYKKCEDGTCHHLLAEMMGLDRNERFSAAAEVVLLTEAVKTSYAEAAKALPSKQEISKTTVMNKVHGLAEEFAVPLPTEKKECKYLFIEADEDHVAEQHGRHYPVSENKSFISRLAYVYEYKQESPKSKGRKELVGRYYFSGVYAGSTGTEKFWNNVADYIDNYYDGDVIKHIFISGDGANWIKTGAKMIHKALFCADKFHLMKYINAASGQMLDEADLAKSELYRLLYKRDREGFFAYVEEMLTCARNQEPVERLKSYVLGNWAAVMRTYHNKIITGCSAESHVSHVLSDRLSSRPMGWSQEGADRMSKLRCFERNYGREKIIDYVQYTRQEKKKTGTDDVEIRTYRNQLERYDQARSYIERMQVTIPYQHVRKVASIREQIKLI